MYVDHTQYIARDLELDRSHVFCLTVFLNQVDAPIARAVLVAIQVEASQLLNADGATQ